MLLEREVENEFPPSPVGSFTAPRPGLGGRLVGGGTELSPLPGPLHYHDSPTVSWLTRFGRMRAWHPATAVPPANKSTAPCWSCWEWKRDGSAARWPRLVALLRVVVPMSWRHDWRGCLSVSKSVRWLSGERASLDRIDWSGGQAINLHFRPQGPASYLDDRRSKQHRHFRRQLRLAVPLRRLLAEGDRFPPIVPQLRHNDSELLFEQFRHQPPMAPHVERLPTQQNGIGTEVLGNLLGVQGVKLLAVFPIEQFWVFRLQKPARWSQTQVAFSPGKTGAHPG